MDSEYQSIHSYVLDEDLKLLAPNGEPLTVRADELFLSMDEDESVGDEDRYVECRLTMVVSPQVYEHIDKGEWLNLKTALRQHEVMFNADIDIDIEAVLDEELLPTLAEYLLQEDISLDDVGKIAACLMDLSQNNLEHPLLNSENWYGTKVTQEMPMPSGIEGRIKQGYTTVWLDDEDLDDDRPNFRGPIYNSAIEFLRDRNIAFFEFSDRDVIQLDSSGDRNPWQFFIHAKEDDGLCLFYGTCPESVPEELRETMAIFLTHANYGLPTGCFELDFRDGEVRFRTSLMVEDEEMRSIDIDNLLGLNWEIVDIYSSAILALIGGKMSLKEAIASVEQN
ncbi:YbjN domain-containing protein [Roseofilum casamattae]|uniref:YbjN domain-containing protein n=1 Tax=Roseofilum casamattae BLCC-M143 TaxID=3022442 RepID=A0ABT7BUF1_9CYAN|nr:YbjN domain-containing protein [Roseofilum casamattae]MDJ1182819.1 YbjN domain-containing protein [Roseofilum casamattae BLCC-M143]